MAKTARIEVRTEPEVKRLIEAAAEIEHLPLSTFVLKTLTDASEKVTGSNSVTYVSEEQFEKLLEYLDSPYEPSEELIKLAKRPSRFVVGDI